jgi:hypothetical protein
MKHIFTSHAGPDTAMAERLANDLRNAGHEGLALALLAVGVMAGVFTGKSLWRTRIGGSEPSFSGTRDISWTVVNFFLVQ